MLSRDQSAATAVQAGVRGFLTRRERIKARSATAVQANVRGY
eukprot:SAG31_NODE_17550_length_666_cov_1.908289_1_plen_41_part_10